MNLFENNESKKNLVDQTLIYLFKNNWNLQIRKVENIKEINYE